jgi:hypothetical protein
MFLLCLASTIPLAPSSGSTAVRLQNRLFHRQPAILHGTTAFGPATTTEENWCRGVSTAEEYYCLVLDQPIKTTVVPRRRARVHWRLTDDRSFIYVHQYMVATLKTWCFNTARTPMIQQQRPLLVCTPFFLCGENKRIYIVFRTTHSKGWNLR